jgi:hypothetical protein
MVYFAWKEANAKTPTFKLCIAEADADKARNVLARIIDMEAAILAALLRKKDLVLDRADPGDRSV